MNKQPPVFHPSFIKVNMIPDQQEVIYGNFGALFLRVVIVAVVV